MSKLHELLAVEKSLENQENKVREELKNTFEKKRHLFEEKHIIFTPLGENEKAVIEQQSDIQTTVKKELGWISTHIVKALDAAYQVAETNTVARGNVILDDEAGTILLKNIPATALLELEKRVNEIQQLVSAIPTLDPAKGFQLDTNRNIYKAREINKNRTKKTNKVLVKYEATDKHPAQTEIVQEDMVVGTISEQEWSGFLTPIEKSDMLNRCEILARAVKAARSRANDAQVNTEKIGSTLVRFIFG